MVRGGVRRGGISTTGSATYLIPAGNTPNDDGLLALKVTTAAGAAPGASTDPATAATARRAAPETL